MSRYYPGFLAAFLIVLLRIAIGWHFLYEGCEKVESTVSGKAPFSAEIYLRNATGPLAPYFRGMLPDVNSLAELDPERLKASWKDDVTRIGDHFGFTLEQRDQAQKVLDENLRWADYWFDDPENVEKRQQYYHDLRQVLETEHDPEALSFQKERAWEARLSVDAARRGLIQPLLAQEKALRESIAKLATPDQVKTAGAASQAYLSWVDRSNISIPGELQTKFAGLSPWTSLDVLNYMTMFGLIVIGICLMAGLLTPLAALSAAAFLSMIYFSMPPWPGMPPNPKAEGHYLIVSKNLIELLACLVIATTPSGHWVGLDALLFGARRRRHLARAAREREQEQDASRRQPIRVG
jgi:uncharacterized membrane protein YphA (DoxX/SURF4 family)